MRATVTAAGAVWRTRVVDQAPPAPPPERAVCARCGCLLRRLKTGGLCDPCIAATPVTDRPDPRRRRRDLEGTRRAILAALPGTAHQVAERAQRAYRTVIWHLRRMERDGVAARDKGSVTVVGERGVARADYWRRVP